MTNFCSTYHIFAAALYDGQQAVGRFPRKRRHERETFISVSVRRARGQAVRLGLEPISVSAASGVDEGDAAVGGRVKVKPKKL